MADHNLTTTAVPATPTTLATLLARLRVELHDEDSERYRWQDDTLGRHLERAVRDLSLVAPRERSSQLLTSGSRDVSLTGLENLVQVLAVEYPSGHYPPAYVPFTTYGGVLSLQVDRLPAAGERLTVYWGQLHTLSPVISTLKPAHEDIVVLGASGYAAVEWANFAVNRANLAGGDAFEHYRRWGAEALQRFNDQLSKLREATRLRSSAVFTVARPPGIHAS